MTMSQLAIFQVGNQMEIFLVIPTTQSASAVAMAML